MGNKIDYKVLLDFSKGKYSYNDYSKVKHWFLNVRDDKSTEQTLYNHWKDLADLETTESLHPIFEKIQYQILLEEKKQEKKIFWGYYRQVAAILLPIIGISVLIYFMARPIQMPAGDWVEINVPEGARIEFLLPDSTSGWLNSGAKLKYPPRFNSHREVELIGEAFFNVKHRAQSDFTVKVPDLYVKVLGTKFNISAYSNESSTEVVLIEGKVELSGNTSAFNQTLRPGEKIAYNRKKNSYSLKNVDPALYAAWKDGYLVIDNEPLSQAVKKIERWYNAEILIEDEMLKKFRFKATFNDEPLEEVLRFIAMTTPIDYQIEKRKYDSNGILKKKKVTIKLK